MIDIAEIDIFDIDIKKNLWKEINFWWNSIFTTITT